MENYLITSLNMEKYVKNYNAPYSTYSLGRSGTKVVKETRKLLVYDKRQQMLVLGLILHEKFQCFFLHLPVFSKGIPKEKNES